jgi:hypothetical protein
MVSEHRIGPVAAGNDDKGEPKQGRARHPQTGRKNRRAPQLRQRSVPTKGVDEMTTQGSRGIGGITTGGIIVIVGIIVAIFWSVILGVIIALIGLVAFGGFARGRWY